MGKGGPSWGKMNVSIRHWKRSRFDELVVTNRRVMFIKDGHRERQAWLDPALATAALDTLQGSVRRAPYTLKRDRALHLQFLVTAAEKTFVFRPLWFPRRLRLLAAIIVFWLGVGLAATVSPVLFIVSIAGFVVFGSGLPIPWQGFAIEIQPTYAASMSVNSMFRSLGPSRTRLEVPDPNERAEVTRHLAEAITELESVFRSRPIRRRR